MKGKGRNNGMDLKGEIRQKIGYLNPGVTTLKESGGAGNKQA